MWKLNNSKSAQRGDTIIEVFMAMAVIGMALAVSYGIANRATQTGRQAQERTEALKLAETQIEVLKGNLNSGLVLSSTYQDVDAYCVLPGGGGNEKIDIDIPPDPTSPCIDVQELYDIRIEYDNSGSAPIYRSVVLWDDPSRTVRDASLTQEQIEDTRNRVELRYRP